MTDTYKVVFMFQKQDTYWEEREEIYSANGKDKHQKVRKDWEQAHKKDKVKLKTIIYQ